MIRLPYYYYVLLITLKINYIEIILNFIKTNKNTTQEL